MQDLLRGQIHLSELLINKMLTEFTNGTEYEGNVSIVLVGEGRVHVQLANPIYRIKELELQLIEFRHDPENTIVQLRVGEVLSNSILTKPLTKALKWKILSGVVQKIGAAYLPEGIQLLDIQGDEIAININQWIRSAIGESLFLPVVGNFLEVAQLSSVKILEGEVAVTVNVRSVVDA